MLVFTISHDRIPETTLRKDLVLKLVRTLKPHSTPVVTLAIDETSTLVATGSADGVIKIWDIQGGFVTHTLKGHEGIISALLFVQIPRASQDVLKPNAKGKKPRTSDQNQDEDTNVAKQLMLVSGVDDGQMRVWDLQTKKAIARLSAHTSVVRGLDYSAEHGLLVSGSRDKTLVFWETKRWKPVKTIPVQDSIEAAGFVSTEDGSLLTYCGGEDGRLRLWPKEGVEIQLDDIIPNRNGSVVNILLDQSAQHLYVVYDDQSINVLHVDSGNPPVQYKSTIFGSHDEVVDMAYVPGSNDSDVELALATNGNEIRILTLHDNEQHAPRSGDEMVVEGREPEGAQLSVKAGAKVLSGHTDIVLCLSVDFNAGLLATGSKDNTARLWSKQGEGWELLRTFTGHTASVGAIALPQSSPQGEQAVELSPGNFLLTGSSDSTIKKWTWQAPSPSSSTKPAGKSLYTRLAHEKDINAIALHPQSHLFATASQDRTIKIWSVSEGEAQGILRGHKRGVWTVAFAPSSLESFAAGQGSTVSGRNLILTGSGDKTVKLWSLADYTCLRTFEGHTNSVLKVLWLPAEALDARGRSDQGLNVASAGGDGLVKIWSLASGECATTLDNHSDRVWTLAVKPASNLSSAQTPHILTSGSADSSVTFWRNTSASTHAAALAQEAAQIEQRQSLSNHIAASNYREAIVLALTLNHPGQLLGLFSKVAATHPSEPGSFTGKLAVDDVLRTLGNEQLYRLLVRVRDWNANARHAAVAQRVLACLVQYYPDTKFYELERMARRGGFGGGRAAAGADGKSSSALGGVQGVRQLLEQIRGYTERHYKRIEELVDESWVVDWLLMEMDGLGTGEGITEMFVGRKGGDVGAGGGAAGFLALEGGDPKEVDGDGDQEMMDGQLELVRVKETNGVKVNGFANADHASGHSDIEGQGEDEDTSSEGSWQGVDDDVVMAS